MASHYAGYGGDFGESFIEDNLKTGAPPFMTNNGIVLADLTWKPVAYEVKEAYAPVRIVRPPRASGWQTAQPFEAVSGHKPLPGRATCASTPLRPTCARTA